MLISREVNLPRLQVRFFNLLNVVDAGNHVYRLAKDGFIVKSF
jgi:hypothetical protein